MARDVTIEKCAAELRSDDLLYFQRSDLGLVIADRRQHFLRVGAEQRRRAIVLHRRAGEGDGVADQRQRMFEGMGRFDLQKP
jgi:hypothetical protein